VKNVQQQLANYDNEVAPTCSLRLISAHIVDPPWKLRSFWKWDMWMDITSEHETSYTTQYQEAFLKNVENEYYTKHQRLLVTKPKIIPNRNLVSSGIPSTSGQSSYNPYDLYSNDEE
jgi:hypothetical protein